MAVLGRGLTGLPLTTDSLIIGVSGLVDELPVGVMFIADHLNENKLFNMTKRFS